MLWLHFSCTSSSIDVANVPLLPDRFGCEEDKEDTSSVAGFCSALVACRILLSNTMHMRAGPAVANALTALHGSS